MHAAKKRSLLLALMVMALALAGCQTGNNSQDRQEDAASAADKRITAGAYVTFGRYPQTEGGTDQTPIEWLVLEVDEANHKALLISRYGLDAQPYNTQHTAVTWEECSLRKWLHGTFLKQAFTAEEQAGILLTDVDNSSGQGYSDWNTEGGNNTQDKIFLLSYAEANRYYGIEYWRVTGAENNTKSQSAPTAYALKQGASVYSNNKTADGTAAGWWWLRSPGYLQHYAARVGADGSLSYNRVSYDNGCVRPAMWVDLESGVF